MGKDFVYLASTSPRRRGLLHQIGVRFELVATAVDEARLPAETPAEYVVRVARAKAQAAHAVLGSAALVLAADTAVVLDERILGKPEDARAAERMLAALSGRTHRVFTAVALQGANRVETRLSSNEVRMRATTLAERRAYCASGEPLDKAGGYAIQGLAAVFIEHLAGSDSGVTGNEAAKIAQDGTIREGERVAGRLKLVRFESATDIERESGARFRARTDVEPVATEARVIGGSLEAANVTVVDRMASLVEISRAFEGLQRGISVLSNDIDGRAIAELGSR